MLKCPVSITDATAAGESIVGGKRVTSRAGGKGVTGRAGGKRGNR